MDKQENGLPAASEGRSKSTACKFPPAGDEGMYRLLFWAVLLIGVHSIAIGTFIFFFTETFYRIFFLAEIQNMFFVRQAGLFLFCLGLFNLSILRCIHDSIFLVKVTIATKYLAFLFLAFQAHLSAHPFIIYMAALGDGSMGLALMVLLWRLKGRSF